MTADLSKKGTFDGRREIYLDYDCMPGIAIYPGECCAPNSNGPRFARLVTK